MNELLVKIIDARGRTDRWHWYEKVEATMVSARTWQVYSLYARA
jgi:hypothetical protein